VCVCVLGSVKKFPDVFDIDDFVPHEFLPPGQSAAGHFYVQVLQRKRHDKGQAGQWLPLHDNAPSHASPDHRTLRTSLPATFGCSVL
jgi:hypothetical protein